MQPDPALEVASRSEEKQRPASRERLLVCLSPSPFSLPLIRATHRLAEAQGAKWFALYVETPSHTRLSQKDQELVSQALYLAAKLGGHPVKVSGFRIGDEILAFARDNRVSKIFVGKPFERRWRRFLGVSLVDHLIWNCGPSRVPEIVLLDLGLPDMEGLEVIKQLRAWSSVPIIVLSARDQERDKVANLDAGADDYLTKPFGIGELLARIRVALRKSLSAEESQQTPFYSLGKIKVDFERRIVLRGQDEVHLTPIEYKLLSILLKHRGKVVTHRQLLKEVWGPSYVEQNAYLRIFILNLRRKLEDDPTRPQYLLTEPGVGYRLMDD